MAPVICGVCYGQAMGRPAVLKSAILPGWGQHSLGHSTRGWVFMGLEATTWLGVGLSYLEGSFNESDYVDLAMEEAGVSAGSRSSDFLDDLADFSSSGEYNDYVRRLARYYYPDDPEAQREYYERHSRYGGDSWSWSSESARIRFEERLRKSRQWYRRAMYIGAFALVNRVVSAIDAALLEEAGSERLYATMTFPERSDLSSVRITVGTRF